MKSFLNRMRTCVCRVKGFTAFQPPAKKKRKETRAQAPPGKKFNY